MTCPTPRRLLPVRGDPVSRSTHERIKHGVKIWYPNTCYWIFREKEAHSDKIHSEMESNSSACSELQFYIH